MAIWKVFKEIRWVKGVISKISEPRSARRRKDFFFPPYIAFMLGDFISMSQASDTVYTEKMQA